MIDIESHWQIDGKIYFLYFNLYIDVYVKTTTTLPSYNIQNWDRLIDRHTDRLIDRWIKTIILNEQKFWGMIECQSFFLSKYTLKNKQMNLSNQNSNLISIYFVSFWYQSLKCYFDVILL